MRGGGFSGASDGSAPRPHRAAAWSIALVLLSACADSGTGSNDAPDPIEYAAQLGTWDYALGDFTAMEPGATIPLVMGFQGLRFASLAVATDATVPQQQAATVYVELPDLGDAYDYVDNQLYFESEVLPDGSPLLVVPSFRVPFEWDPEQLNGTRVRVTAEISASDGHVARVEGEFRLTTDEGCMHQPDGTIVCD